MKIGFQEQLHLKIIFSGGWERIRRACGRLRGRRIPSLPARVGNKIFRAGKWLGIFFPSAPPVPRTFGKPTRRIRFVVSAPGVAPFPTPAAQIRPAWGIGVRFLSPAAKYLCIKYFADCINLRENSYIWTKYELAMPRLPILVASLFCHMALLSAQTPPSIVAYNNKKNCLGREQ